MTTTSPATTEQLLNLLQNSNLHTTLINTFMALQSSDMPKTQARISQLIKDVRNDELKAQGGDSCAVGKTVFAADNEEQLHKVKAMMNLLRRSKQSEDREQRRNTKRRYTQSETETFTNITHDAAYWKLVGVQMHDAPLVQKSLSLFKHQHPYLKHVRFVGKFFALERNYFVIETDHDGDKTLSDEELSAFKQNGNATRYRVRFGATEQPSELPAERGTTNHFRYWVCTSGESLASSNWVRLPDVTPAQILTAKRLKKYLTGRLDAPIQSYPEFPGTEANYLRAIIARIVCATTIAPKGVYKIWSPPEEDEDEDEPREPVVPPVSDVVRAGSSDEDEDDDDEEGGGLNLNTLQNAENWVHLYPLILDVGRATEYKPPKLPSDDDEEDEEEEEDESKVPRLRPLNSDSGMKQPDYLKPLEKTKKSEDEEDEEDEDEEEEGEGDIKKGEYSPWSFQSYGDLDAPNAVVLARSLRWPGAYSFSTADGKKTANIYIGDGVKENGDLNVHTPVIPEPIQQEIAEPKQQKDPSVSNEKRVRDFGEDPINENDEEEGEGEGEDA